MILRLWLLVVLTLAGAFAPSRAGARTVETRTWDFFPTTANVRPESAPQVADSHLGNLVCGYELAPGYSQPAEGNVGAFDDLISAGSKGDNITPHHVPSANLMGEQGVARGKAISINMEQPSPGAGGRHRATFTYGTQADAAMTPRDALAAGVRDLRKIYQKDGFYESMRKQMAELIKKNREEFPDIFNKK